MAWLMVRCHQPLDEALRHARRAVELEPENSGFLDTLAEIHFQRGDQEKAVAAMERCKQLRPGYSYFRKQLLRFKAGDKSAELPIPWEQADKHWWLSSQEPNSSVFSSG